MCVGTCLNGTQALDPSAACGYAYDKMAYCFADAGTLTCLNGIVGAYVQTDPKACAAESIHYNSVCAPDG